VTPFIAFSLIVNMITRNSAVRLNCVSFLHYYKHQIFLNWNMKEIINQRREKQRLHLVKIQTWEL